MKEKWFKWVRLTIRLSIVLGPFMVPGPAAANSVAIANLLIEEGTSATSATINGQDTRHLEESWQGNEKLSFRGEVTLTTGESWSKTKTVRKPAKCGEPTPTPQVVVTEELPPTIESTPTEEIPSPTAIASETTATSAPTDTPVQETETSTQRLWILIRGILHRKGRKSK